MRGGILIKILELLAALVVVESILSNECVSPLSSNNKWPLVKRAAEETTGKTKADSEKERRIRIEVQVLYFGKTARGCASGYGFSYRRRCVVELLRGGGVGMRRRQRSDAQRELVIGRRVRRPSEEGSVLRVVHLVEPQRDST